MHGMKRFYGKATVTPADGEYGVSLDERPLRTPAKAMLIVPTAALASAIAEEWNVQGDDVRLDQMGLTRLASTAIDLVAMRRAETVADIAKYAATDLVCYRAPHPPALAARQYEAWQPLIDWSSLRFDAPLEVTIGIVPIVQPPSSLRALAAAVETYTSMELTALHLATTACGSLLIALGLMEGRLDGEAAFGVSQIDETFEIESWGEDWEQMQRRAALKDDIALAAQFIGLLHG